MLNIIKVPAGDRFDHAKRDLETFQHTVNAGIGPVHRLGHLELE